MSRHFGVSNPAVVAVSQASNLVRSADSQVAPVAAGQSISTFEDTAVNIVLTASDANGDSLTYTVVSNPSNGMLTGTAPNLTYTPSANYNGSDSFTFKANDGIADSAVATVSITVTAVNDNPVANAQSVSVLEDGYVAITLTGSDIDGNTLTYTVVASPSNGGLTGSAPNLIYTPNANYNGSDSFTFRVNDGYVNSSTATVSITVTAANDTPVANAQSVSVLEDGYVAITLTGSDIDGNTLTYTVVASPSNGGLTGTAPNLIYAPNPNYNGSDSFTFRVNDGYVNSSTATVSITVTAVNDTPVATAQSVSVSHNTATAITLAGSDVEGSALTYTVVTNPTNGSLTGTAPNLTYTPGSGYVGSDSFTFRVNDGTANSAAATVTLTVAAAAAAVDASFANVSLLLKADGANDSTSFVDSSANSFAISRFGNTKISTVSSQYGGSSAYFDGNGDYLSAANNAALNFGSDNFTIEMWLNPQYISGGWTQKDLFAKRASAAVYGLLCYIRRNNSTGLFQLEFYVPTAGASAWQIIYATSTFTGWTHVAFVRNGTEWAAYINGVKSVMSVPIVASFTIPSNSAAFTFGASSAAVAGPGSAGYQGYMDDIRITKGVARYTANFTPPGSLPTSGT